MSILSGCVGFGLWYLYMTYTRYITTDYDSDDSDYLDDFGDDEEIREINQRTLDPIRRSSRISHLYGPNYPYVLIIIDMQDQFATSRNRQTIITIQKMVVEAKRDGAFIVTAHYMRYGKTRPEIRNMLTNYANHDYCYADQDDKSGAIHTKLVRHNVRTNIIKICGVNTGACVKATVMGLNSLYPDSHFLVFNRACNCYCNQYTTCDGHNLGRLNNVSFVS